MVKRRDRHGRGLRGPVVAPGPGGSRRATSRLAAGQVTRTEAFLAAVHDAVGRVQTNCPEVLTGVDIGVEDVPNSAAAGGRVPLAAATEASGGFPARIVIFRRPLEHRSATRRGLRILVHRTLVEQLSALTGRTVADIDPHLEDED